MGRYRRLSGCAGIWTVVPVPEIVRVQVRKIVARRFGAIHFLIDLPPTTHRGRVARAGPTSRVNGIRDELFGREPSGFRSPCRLRLRARTKRAVIVNLSPLDATLASWSVSAHSKGLTISISPLDATLTRNAGGIFLQFVLSFTPLPRFFASLPSPLPNATSRLARIFAITARRSSIDRKSTRLNSSHPSISYAVFCLKKKKQH